MNDSTDLIRAPQGALAWTPARGYLYEPAEVPAHVEAGELVLVVSDDGYLRGVAHYDRAPLASLLRVEGDLAEIVARLDDLGDTVAGIDTGIATDVNMLRARMDALVHRVDQLAARA